MKPECPTCHQKITHDCLAQGHKWVSSIYGSSSDGHNFENRECQLCGTRESRSYKQELVVTKDSGWQRAS